MIRFFRSILKVFRFYFNITLAALAAFFALVLQIIESENICGAQEGYSFTDQFQACTLAINMALPKKSFEAEAYAARGELLFRKGNMRGAFGDYDRAVQLDPREGRYLYNRALARARIEPMLPSDYRAAIKDAYRATELGAPFPLASERIAFWFLELDEHKKALKTAEFAIEEGAPDPMAVARYVKIVALFEFDAFPLVETEATVLIEQAEQDVFKGIGFWYRGVARCAQGDMDGYGSDLGRATVNPNFKLHDYLSGLRRDGVYDGPVSATVTRSVAQALRRMDPKACGAATRPVVPG